MILIFWIFSKRKYIIIQIYPPKVQNYGNFRHFWTMFHRDNYIKWNLLIMEFTIWDSTFGYSVPLCVTLVFLNYLIIWVIKTGFLRHIFIAETSGRFTKKLSNFLLIQYFIVKNWILVTHNGMDISEIIPLLVTHSIGYTL